MQGLLRLLDWSGSDNLASAELSYPLPRRFQLFGLQTFGYTGHVVLPVSANVRQAGVAFNGQLKLELLVCEQVCVPQTLHLSITLPQGPASPDTEAQLINRFQSMVPRHDAAAGIKIAAATFDRLADGKAAIKIIAESNETFAAPDVIAEIEPPIALGPPQVALSADGNSATITLPVAQDLPAGTSLAGRPAVFTVMDGLRAAESKKSITAGSASGASSTSAIVGMIGVALLGGLVLNLMPCVLPILSLKILSFATQSGAPAAEVRASFVATAAGIVTSMLGIAGTLVAFKSAGTAIGWGVQFQQPVFISAMALIVALFACNFWGFFEIALPASLSNRIGQANPGQGSVWGNFAMGAFATLLATPCSAPFVGTAVGFALAQGPREIFAIFTALGLGLAAPYLIVAAVPSTARLMPRPGRWMVTLRWISGLALAATAAWLLSILAAQVGWQTATIAAALLTVIVALLYAAHNSGLSQSRAISGTAVLSLAVLALPLSTDGVRSQQSTGTPEQARIAWAAFDEQEIRSLVAQGKTVFVDVTADWCITCQANKKVVLNRLPTAERIRKQAVPMQADWTSPDPKISKFLARFGRYGIPLNVVFGPAKPSGILLPELLTEDAVRSALQQASAKTTGPG